MTKFQELAYPKGPVHARTHFVGTDSENNGRDSKF
jgi:hypothetical protein